MTDAATPALPRTPPIPGLYFRPYCNERDLPALVELLRAADEANGEEMVASIGRLRAHYRNMTRIDPTQDVILGFIDDRLVAHSLIEWADTAYGERHFNSLGSVHPEWRRRGIGGAMMARNEARLVEIARAQDFDGSPVLTTWMQDLDLGAVALVKQRGYQHTRVYHHMVRPTLDDITILPLPVGLEVRPVTPELLPAYWEAICEAFRDHFGAWDDSDSAFRSWIDSPHFDLGLQIVAFDSDEIAGSIHAAVDPAENQVHGYLRGWSEPIFTRRPWRRRGLAAALLGRALVALRDCGMTSAQLHVDAENTNQARAFYQRHGFAVASSSSEWHKLLRV